MNKRQQLSLGTHQRTITFIDSHALRTGPLERLVLELDACVARLAALVASQKFFAGERNLQVMRVERLRRAVRAQMLQVKRWAPRLLKDLPGVEAARHVPHATASTATILAAATAMIKAVQPHKSEYLRARFAPDFLKRLRTDVGDLAKSAKAVPQEAKHLADVTAAIPPLLREAREIERAMDGTMITLADAGDRRALAWQNARRVGKVRGRKRKPRD